MRACILLAGGGKYNETKQRRPPPPLCHPHSVAHCNKDVITMVSGLRAFPQSGLYGAARLLLLDVGWRRQRLRGSREWGGGARSHRRRKPWPERPRQRQIHIVHIWACPDDTCLLTSRLDGGTGYAERSKANTMPRLRHVSSYCNEIVQFAP